MKIQPPIQPFRGTRGMDSWGSGNFGASRDGGGRQHAGLDFIAVVGDFVRSPITGVVSHIGIAYPDAKLGSLHIDGRGEHAGWFVKILYCDPQAGIGGRDVQAGDILGNAQDVAGYWHAKKPDHQGEMRNHVHVELMSTDPRAVDPAHYLPDALIVSKDLLA